MSIKLISSMTLVSRKVFISIEKNQNESSQFIICNTSQLKPYSPWGTFSDSLSLGKVSLYLISWHSVLALSNHLPWTIVLEVYIVWISVYLYDILARQSGLFHITVSSKFCTMYVTKIRLEYTFWKTCWIK